MTIFNNIFFYLFLLALIITIYYKLTLIKKNKELISAHNLLAEKINSIRNDHLNTLEKIRIEMLRREDDRNRQWYESEKELLQVLNSISLVFDLNEKIERNELNQLIQKIDEIFKIIKNNLNQNTLK